MRSLGFTFILALLAAAATGLAAWQWAGRDFNRWLGAPPIPVGHRLYDSFSPSDVKRIRVIDNSVVATFKLGENGWESIKPWKDRMDPRAALSIIHFSLGLRVEDYAREDEVDARKVGLGEESRIDIRLEDRDGHQLARYKIGRRTPWQATFPDRDTPVDTVFIQRRDGDQKNYVYTCTGDIQGIFEDGMKLLRDHHPFYFNPLALQKIRIRAQEGELTLTRESPDIPEIPATADHKVIPARPGSPWRIVKPVELATDPLAVKSLIEGLYELLATNVTDREGTILPAFGGQGKSGQIAITYFGSNEEVVLDYQLPESPNSATVPATVSNRPNALFELPVKPGKGGVSLASLPLAVNDLRKVNLTTLNIKAVHAIRILPAKSYEIQISREAQGPWMTTILGKTAEANEERLYSLLKTVTEGRAIKFESDTATDLKPWGLDHPLLSLQFTASGNQTLELNFGTDGKGGYFMNRAGTPTVMQVEESLISSIPMQPYEWRQARIWSIDRTNLKALSRRKEGEPPLDLLYDDTKPAWTANMDATDVTSRLNPDRANYLLGALEGPKVARWLSPSDASAKAALLKPSLAFRVIEDTTDELDDVNGRITRELLLAPATRNATPGFYYGRLGDDPQPFTIDPATYQKLATDLLEE